VCEKLTGGMKRSFSTPVGLGPTLCLFGLFLKGHTASAIEQRLDRNLAWRKQSAAGSIRSNPERPGVFYHCESIAVVL